MGLFNVVDPVTGVTLKQGDPIVAIMLQRRTGGYPDAVTGLAVRPHHPTGLFEPASLPIYGKMGDTGDVVPVKGQLSVKAFVEMAGASSWDQAFATATDFSGSGLAYPIDRLSAHLGQTKPVTEVLGISVVHRSSFEKMLSSRYSRTDKQADIDDLVAILSDLARKSAEGDSKATYDLISLQGLGCGSRRYDHSDGRAIELPPLAGVLQHREGGDWVSSDFSQWLTTEGPLRTNTSDRLDRETLDALWELQAFQEGLDAIGHLLLPNKSHGYSTNAVTAIDMAVLTIQRGADQIQELIEDDRDLRDADVERLRAKMMELDELKDRMAALLQQASPSP
ncbi:hypothetical protein [Bosea sp. RAC05]|uniref:hypothetical protein n=1 Tax=Bosea sp. RAC05 TaxID=1842539 RepID=UPI00083E1E80|nr:hypothetical protein [Bosea sp. RAC05]AOG03457.1 hypothetical protein BSY19_4739 [Bosea sp. RAC05]